MKKLFFLFLLPLNIFAQPMIDQGGDDWAGKVSQSLDLIRKTDSSAYKTIREHCDRVSFWMGGFSSTTVTENQERVILISTNDMKFGSINDVAAVLVHESMHLWILDNKVGINPDAEEMLCYTIELEFLKKIPNVENVLLDHANDQIKLYKNKLLRK